MRDLKDWLDTASDNDSLSQLPHTMRLGSASIPILKARIAYLRAIYTKAKSNPSILKPVFVAIPEIEQALIKNIQWLKAGGTQYNTQSGEAERLVNKIEAVRNNKSRMSSALNHKRKRK